MTFVLSILALFVGLLAVYLAADSKQSIEAKIRNHSDVNAKAMKKSLEECVNSISYLSERIVELEQHSGDFPTFKHEIIGELATINKKISDIRHELLTQNVPLSRESASKKADSVAES